MKRRRTDRVRETV